MNTPPHSANAHGSAPQGGQAVGVGDAPPETGTPGNTVIDPVCGMQVDPARTAHHAGHAGTTYHFCSARCREKFVVDPAKVLSASAAAPAIPTPVGTIYTCPMHPQIRQQGPGTCPICGMALDPAAESGGGHDHHMMEH